MAGEDSLPPGLDEIRAVMADAPGPDLEAATAAVTRRAQIERAAGPLGDLGDLVEWLATWQGRHPPSVRRPRTAVFAGTHGIAHGLGQAAGFRSAGKLVESAVAGGAPVNAACTVADADLRVYEMSLETPTLDATAGPAMSEEECARAIAYGMMAVEQGLDLVCLDTAGMGGEVAAAALVHLLLGGIPADWLPEGCEPGVAGLIESIAGRHQGAGDPFELLRRVGGFEMCAVAGAVIACRLARTPVVLGGYAALAAAAVLFAFDGKFLQHCRLAGSHEQRTGRQRLAEALGLQTVANFGSSLGSGTEATLAVPVLKAAVEIHTATASISA